MGLHQLKAVVLAPVAELLKKRGFRKHGLRFRASRGDARLLIVVQSGQTSDRSHLKVTVNLSIHIGVLDRDSAVVAPEGHWRQRIGQFMLGCPDLWWLCHDDETARHAGEEIAAILENAALPELERLASREALASFGQQGARPA